MNYKSDFLHILQERGFIYQISDAENLDKLLTRKKISAYIGFDPTAPSLHAGSLISIMMLYWLQQTGHKPIVLMGGGTGLIGDPSFKDDARQLLSAEKINDNIAKIQKVFSAYLKLGEGKQDAVLCNNASWLTPLNYIEFLRDIGQFFSVNRMLSFESVKQRLDRQHSLSFLEFNYMLLQAYDFVELFKKHDTVLQMGGSDQWGNIINGIELGHRLRTEQLYGLTTPLLTTASGAKMGKTLGGAIWLNEELLQPYDFWQYWRNTEDADVVRFLKLYTTLPLTEIEKLATLQGAELNEAKKILATEITALLHGRDAAETAAETAHTTFEKKQIATHLKTLYLTKTQLKEGVGILTLIVEAGFAKSNSEARRHVQGGAIKLDGTAVKDEKLILFELAPDTLLSFGKKQHILLKAE